MKDKTLNNPKKELDDLIVESEKSDAELEKILNQEKHIRRDHYHGIHHFDKAGHHDDISSDEFSVKQLLKVNKRSWLMQISAAGVVLALAIVASLIDALFEHLSLNVGGAVIDTRIFDLMMIILGIPIAGFYGSLIVAAIEPWFHFLIDSDHLPVQVVLTSIDYMLVVIVFFFIYYAAFKNSPIHKEPSKSKRIFKSVVPGVVIVPVLSLVFSLTFLISLWIGVTGNNVSKKDYGILFLISLGIELARFIVMYVLFVLVERKMKPINHRYR